MTNKTQEQTEPTVAPVDFEEILRILGYDYKVEENKEKQALYRKLVHMGMSDLAEAILV